MTKKKNNYTTPEEGLELLEKAESKYSRFENIPPVDFTVDINPKKHKTKLKSIRLTEFIIEGYEELAKDYKTKPQTLIKTVLEEYLNKHNKSRPINQ